jgi:hypothetical protein
MPFALSACSQGDLSAVLTLLELGADPNRGTIPALHALVYADEFGKVHIQIAEALLQHGADCLLPLTTRHILDTDCSMLARPANEEYMPGMSACGAPARIWAAGPEQLGAYCTAAAGCCATRAPAAFQLQPQQPGGAPGSGWCTDIAGSRHA